MSDTWTTNAMPDAENITLEKIKESMRLLEAIPKEPIYRFQATKFIEGNDAYKLNVKALSPVPNLYPYDYLVVMSFELARKIKQLEPDIEIHFPTYKEDKSLWQEIKGLLSQCLDTWEVSDWITK